MNAMLSEEELTRLMAEAGDSFEVPEPPSYEVSAAAERTPVWRRRWVQGAAAVAVVAIGLAAVTAVGDSRVIYQQNAETGAPSALPGTPTGPKDAGAGSVGGALAPGLGGVPGSSAGQAGAAVGSDGARIVKTGEISLVVDEGRVSATVARLQSTVTALRGYVAESTTDEADEHPSATMTVRVPVSSFERLVTQVRSLGAKVVSQSSSGKDVTASYADTQAQIRTLTAARERYLAILARARTIAETLSVQQRIDEVQGRIDRLEGQRRLLADQSDFGTLLVRVGEEDGDVAVTATRSGWGKAWDEAKHGFTSGVQSLIAHSGRTLLLLLCAAALLALGRVGWRVLRRRMV